MTDLWPDLLACLGLRVLPDGSFEGRNQRLEYHRLFGGQLLGQFVRAASLSCPGKAVTSVHVLFPRAGRREEPVRYEVERHHEGSAFATLAIEARQAAGVIATAAMSMHVHEEGLSQQAISPVRSVLGAEHQVRLDLIPWETRSATDLDARDRGAPELAAADDGVVGTPLDEQVAIRVQPAPVPSGEPAIRVQRAVPAVLSGDLLALTNTSPLCPGPASSPSSARTWNSIPGSARPTDPSRSRTAGSSDVSGARWS
jgi:hypothetical protein